MSSKTSIETSENIEVAEDSTSAVDQRLAEIAAAVEAHKAAGAGKNDMVDGMACPTDPAERAACESCQ